MSSSLRDYYEVVRLLFRIVDYDANMRLVDEILERLQSMLDERDTLERKYAALSGEMSRMLTESILVREYGAAESPLPSADSKETHTLIIHPSQHEEDLVPNVIVTKVDEGEIPVIATVVMSASGAPSLVVTEIAGTGDAVEGDVEEEEEEDAVAENVDDGEVEEAVEAEEEEAEEEAEEEEEVEEAVEEEEEEVEEEEVEEEAAEEEDEGMEVITIKKKKYFCGETSKKVYVYVDEESAGDCLGVFKDGKIVPL